MAPREGARILLLLLFQDFKKNCNYIKGKKRTNWGETRMKFRTAIILVSYFMEISFIVREKKFENRRKLAIWMRWKWRVIDFLLSKKKFCNLIFWGKLLKMGGFGLRGTGKRAGGGSHHVTQKSVGIDIFWPHAVWARFGSLSHTIFLFSIFIFLSTFHTFL